VGTALHIDVPGAGAVSAALDRPEDPTALLVLAHGAGAGMDHGFMEGLSRRLAGRGVAVLRFNFPYMERGGWPPDRADVAAAAVRAAVERAAELAGDPVALPLFAGGKSFGGRMTSTAAARGMLAAADPAGIVFFGFPLHPAGKPGTSRADHLADVPHPLLFIQGTRDRLADLGLLRPVVEDLGERATLHVVEDADHGFGVTRRSGRTDDEALDEVAEAAVAWMARVTTQRRGT
jgi:predicted alpha/beta-hydrolase family hydrolase